MSVDKAVARPTGSAGSGRVGLGVAALLISAAMMNVAFTMLIPLVPELIDRLQLSPLGVAAAFSGFALAKAMAQPIGGVLVDRVRQLQLLAAAGLGLTALTTAALALADTGWQVLVLRLAWGFAEGLTMPALYRLAVVLASADGVDSGRVLGWFGGSATAGMALGPLLVDLLNEPLGFHGVFLVGAAITALGGVLLLSLRRVVATEAVQPETDESAVPLRGRAMVALATLVGVFAVVDLVNNGMYAALEPVVPLDLQKIGVVDPVGASALLFTSGLAVFGVMSMLAGRIVERRPLLEIAGGAFLLAAAGLLISGLASGSAAFCIGFLLFMACHPVLYVLTRRGISTVPRHQMGRAFGAFGLASDVGFVLGPLVGMLLYDHLDRTMFVLLALLAAVAGIAALLLRGLPSRLLVDLGGQPEPSWSGTSSSSIVPQVPQVPG